MRCEDVAADAAPHVTVQTQLLGCVALHGGVALVGYGVHCDQALLAAFAGDQAAAWFAVAAAAWFTAAPPGTAAWERHAAPSLAKACRILGALRVANPDLRAALDLPPLPAPMCAASPGERANV